jgi:signal transduction histidine kinase
MVTALERLGSVVADDAVAVVWSADDGRVVSATPTFCDLVGWRPRDLVGRSAAALGLHVAASDRGAADDTEPWRVTSAQVDLHTQSNGSTRVEARSHLMRVRGERLVFTVVDAAPQELGLLELMLNGMPLAIIALDRDLRIVRVNTRAAVMLDAPEARSIGRSLRDALPEIALGLEADLLAILDGGAPRLAVELGVPDRRYLASYFPLLAPNGAVNGVGCMFVDVTEQREAETALSDSEEHRRVIFGQMLRAEEAERARIALDLHDDTIQVLAASLMMADGVIALARRRDQTEIAARLTKARAVLESATERARRLMFELHPTLLDQRGLNAALTALADQTGQQINATWRVDATDARYSWQVEALAFRIVREAVMNIRKHSQAPHFTIRLVERDRRLHGSVRDTGRGFDVQEVIDGAERPLHLGLQSSEERIRLAGGHLDVTSATTPGSSGTEVSFWLHLDADDSSGS